MANVTKLSRSFKQALIGAVPSIPVVWTLTAGISPIETIVDGMTFYEFSNLDSQEMNTEVTIPTNYLGATPINLVSGTFFTTPVVGNVLFKAYVSLIRPSSTVEGAYPNDYTSTNVQIPVSIVSNQFTEIPSIDIATALGVVGISVQANDRLRVKVYRDIAGEAPSVAGNVYLLKQSFVVKFS
jgi:hypothetical protein